MHDDYYVIGYRALGNISAAEKTRRRLLVPISRAAVSAGSFCHVYFIYRSEQERGLKVMRTSVNKIQYI